MEYAKLGKKQIPNYILLVLGLKSNFINPFPPALSLVYKPPFLVPTNAFINFYGVLAKQKDSLMEYYSGSDQGFLEELLALRPHDHPFWESAFLPKPDSTFNNNNAIGCWGAFDSLEHPNPFANLPHLYHSLPQGFSSLPFDLNYQTQIPTTSSSSLVNAVHDHSNNNVLSHDYEADLDYPTIFSDFDDPPANFCKTEPLLQVPPREGFKGKLKKRIDGQPSKNLMAERRRRKRLNDRLSMLRSVVPKISKMDRTSILGDTIDYMKELIERINKLQEEIEVGPDEQKFACIFNDIHDVVKPNEASSSSSSSSSFMIRNSPKFDVERKGNSNVETRVEICCAPKPGLLLSTVKTLEALDLEIQHCVVSCFNDFAFKASCSQELEQSGIMSSEDIKQALFRNAGYGGRCL